MKLWPPSASRDRDAAAAAYAGAVLPSSGTPWREADWCTVDFELTGLDPRRDEIIAFGAVPIEAGRIRAGGALSQLVRPARDIGEAAIRIHGIRDLDLADAPPLEAAVIPLLEAIAGRIVVFHTAAVDRPFLKRALADHGVRFRGPTVDTEVLGRLWLYERDRRLTRRLALGGLARSLGLPIERPHDALADALTTAQAFIALAAHLDALRPESVGSLAHADRRVDSLWLFEDHSRQ